MTGNQAIRLSGYQAKGETENPDIPITRYPDTPIRYKAGFTLLEVMVAVFILGVGLLAIIHLFPIGLKASKISQDTTVASFLAQAKIEELKNTVWSNIGNESKSEISGTIFSQEVIVNELEADLLKRITVAVFWTDYGAQRSVKLVTLRTNYEKTM